MKTKGLACPHCGCRHSEVVNVYHHTFTFRGRSKTVVRRRRKCRHCALPFFTNETVETDVEPPQGPPEEHQPDGNRLEHPKNPFL